MEIRHQKTIKNHTIWQNSNNKTQFEELLLNLWQMLFVSVTCPITIIFLNSVSIQSRLSHEHLYNNVNV